MAAADARQERASFLLQLGLTQRLDGADLHGSDLRGVYLPNRSFVATLLNGSEISNAKLFFGNFRHASFVAATATGADFGGSTFQHADLTGADLSGANLVDADLRWSCLAGANLAGADLRHARLGDADLDGIVLDQADLAFADLAHADLSQCDLSGVELAAALFDESTTWPAGHRQPPCTSRYSDAWEQGGMSLSDWLVRRRKLDENGAGAADRAGSEVFRGRRS